MRVVQYTLKIRYIMVPFAPLIVTLLASCCLLQASFSVQHSKSGSKSSNQRTGAPSRSRSLRSEEIACRLATSTSDLWALHVQSWALNIFMSDLYTMIYMALWKRFATSSTSKKKGPNQTPRQTLKRMCIWPGTCHKRACKMEAPLWRYPRWVDFRYLQRRATGACARDDSNTSTFTFTQRNESDDPNHEPPFVLPMPLLYTHYIYSRNGTQKCVRLKVIPSPQCARINWGFFTNKKCLS